jgi:NADH:ubiquinone oxidoreductase subunit D
MCLERQAEPVAISRPRSIVRHITPLEQICLGTKIADFVALFGVLDVVMGELDR